MILYGHFRCVAQRGRLNERLRMTLSGSSARKDTSQRLLQKAKLCQQTPMSLTNNQNPAALKRWTKTDMSAVSRRVKSSKNSCQQQHNAPKSKKAKRLKTINLSAVSNDDSSESEREEHTLYKQKSIRNKKDKVVYNLSSGSWFFWTWWRRTLLRREIPGAKKKRYRKQHESRRDYSFDHRAGRHSKQKTSSKIPLQWERVGVIIIFGFRIHGHWRWFRTIQNADILGGKPSSTTFSTSISDTISSKLKRKKRHNKLIDFGDLLDNISKHNNGQDISVNIEHKQKLHITTPRR